jgi:hypothetical protein
MQSEMERFPRLFRNAETVPGLTWPTMVIGGGNPTKGEVPGRLTLDLGGVTVQVWRPANGHTRGDTIAWIEEEKVLFSGDLVEYERRRLHRRRPPGGMAGHAGSAARAEGRGHRARPRRSHEGQCRGEQGARLHQALGGDAVRCGKEAAAANMDLKTAMAHTRKTMDPVFGHVFIYEHCLPFDVSRAYDEAKRHQEPAHLDGRARQGNVEGTTGLKSRAYFCHCGPL